MEKTMWTLVASVQVLNCRNHLPHPWRAKRRTPLPPLLPLLHQSWHEIWSNDWLGLCGSGAKWFIPWKRTVGENWFLFWLSGCLSGWVSDWGSVSCIWSSSSASVGILFESLTNVTFIQFGNNNSQPFSEGIDQYFLSERNMNGWISFDYNYSIDINFIVSTNIQYLIFWTFCEDIVS